MNFFSQFIFSIRKGFGFEDKSKLIVELIRRQNSIESTFLEPIYRGASNIGTQIASILCKPKNSKTVYHSAKCLVRRNDEKDIYTVDYIDDNPDADRNMFFGGNVHIQTL